MDETEFVISRGVKQGGKLSPQLYNFYIDNLLEDINNSTCGIQCGDSRVPIMGYCDDTIQMCHLISHLQNLVNKYVEYSKRWLIKFNFNKSTIMNVGAKLIDDEAIMIENDGVRLPVVGKCKVMQNETGKQLPSK